MQNPGQHIARLVEARDHDPFGLLGAHRHDNRWRLRTWQPGAHKVSLRLGGQVIPATPLHQAGVFEVVVSARPPRPWQWEVDGKTRHDAYAFPPTATPDALYLFGEGRNLHSERLLGARCEARDDVAGVCFRVWAPGAARVSVVGDFNGWDGRIHPMQSLGESGVWELFVPAVTAGALYKFELRQRDSGAVFLRADPYARRTELRPATASVVCAESQYPWRDSDWCADRSRRDWRVAPFNCYEIHAGSWLRHPDGRFYSWCELAERLVPHVQALGCTHIELLPITEHPLDESWGYQSTGFFAPSARFGDPDGLRAFVDTCHAAGLSCVLDWVPGHFPVDDGALAHFDGTPLYEHADPRLQRHPDWGTSSFNYTRHEVRSFLLSSARYWLEEFHFDGLRVDAVASMLYLDYSRRDGEWVPNRHGGRENLEAIEFLQALNSLVSESFPGVLTIAEESTAWPRVTHPVSDGGLGFSMKWNMGWMNDSLRYFALDPIHRRYHHALLTFGQLYAYSECFVLPLSHDEVVHGKGSLLRKMPGDDGQRFANLRLLLAWQMTSPGKKLNFMGNEFAQSSEWASQRELDWAESLALPHAGVRRLAGDLGNLYLASPALHAWDHRPEGFQWLDCNDAEQSTLSYLRLGPAGERVLVVLNFTPVLRDNFRVGVPSMGQWQVLVNSDSRHYGGGDRGETAVEAEAVPWHGQPLSIVITLPPLSALLMTACAS